MAGVAHRCARATETGGAWTPSLVLLGWFLLRRGISEPSRLLEDRQNGVTDKPT
jgi:hypothetical protein